MRIQASIGDLGPRLPDLTTVGATYGDILPHARAVLDAAQLDALLVFGFTIGALSLTMAKRKRIPPCHMQAW